ncbi:MAG TPA: hypothetical protein VH369_22305 [Bryobacteraceae bacterium]|jgi:hypothetical protein
MPILHDSVAYCQGLCDSIFAAELLAYCVCGARVCSSCSREWNGLLVCPSCLEAEMRSSFAAAPRERWETT